MSAINTLTRFEYCLLNFTLSALNSEYLSHLDSLRVCDRTYTGCGMYIKFSYLKSPQAHSQETISIGSNVYIDINNLQHGAGCMVYVDDGLIRELEIFTHGQEDFPTKIDYFYFKDLDD